MVVEKLRSWVTRANCGVEGVRGQGTRPQLWGLSGFGVGKRIRAQLWELKRLYI